MAQIIPENNTVTNMGNWMIQMQVKTTLKFAQQPMIRLHVSEAF
jgi:hypothetical protein